MIPPFRFLFCAVTGAVAISGQLIANELRATPIPSERNEPFQGRLPDPRYRSPFGIWEIDRVASMVARATGEHLTGTIHISDDAHSPLASMRGVTPRGEITINPRAAAAVSPNSWAFVIGHEFAHQIYGFGYQNSTDPDQELKADIIGAKFAIDAGFDFPAHLAWILMRPNGGDPMHGLQHSRAMRLARSFQISAEEIRIQMMTTRSICNQ